jgi:uncharacterized repeat protein (TIGR04076 family)
LTEEFFQEVEGGAILFLPYPSKFALIEPAVEFSQTKEEKEMPKRHPLKITVLQKLSAKEVYGKPLPEVAEDVTPYCDRLEVGQEFRVDESGAMPAGFCTWAWHDIYPAVTGLRFGGNYPWIKREGLIYSCCSDGARPVFFKIERL